MATDTYRVVFDGNVPQGRTQEQAAKALMAILKVPESRARGFCSGKREVLRSGLPRELADKYVAALQRSGFNAGVVSATASRPTPRPAAPDTATAPPPAPATGRYTEYKVIQVMEGGCSSILFGSAQLPIQKIERRLNQEAAAGWQVVFQVIEQRRLFLLWTRESMIITLGR